MKNDFFPFRNGLFCHPSDFEHPHQRLGKMEKWNLLLKIRGIGKHLIAMLKVRKRYFVFKRLLC